MIIATVTALMILFSGGYEVFFAENLEKGIKNYVLEKERQKELLAQTKEMKAFAKAYHKDRKGKYKEFGDIYVSYATTEEQLQGFFNDLKQVQLDFQKGFVEQRVEITKGITEAEWNNIVESSREARQKKVDKAAAKKSKEKPFFKKTRTAIEEISDTQAREEVEQGLEAIIEGIRGFEKSLSQINVLENDLLVKKSESASELASLYTELNELRQESFVAVKDFHTIVQSNLALEQGQELLKTFYKEMEITSI